MYKNTINSLTKTQKKIYNVIREVDMNLNDDLDKYKNQLVEKGQVSPNIFEKVEEPKQEEQKTTKDKLVEDMFEKAVVVKVQQDENLKNEVLGTAQTFVNTKMQVIKQNVDTEHKEANFNNKKDACESYGFNEKTTPIWATNFMSWGYNVMLAIWLFIGTFTFMPVIFVMKKINVGLKKTWLALLFALALYIMVTIVPILTTVFIK